jgi:tetratricopeptide (TPR) repeat protein
MRIGLVLQPFTEQTLALALAAQIGATDIVAGMPEGDFDALVRMKSRIEDAGLRLSVIEGLVPIDEVVLGSDGRDERIRAFQEGLAFADGRTDVALAAFRDAGGLDPTMTMADRFAARILAEQGRPAEALTLYAALRERLPDDAEPRVAAGIVLSGMGRLEEAEVAFREALSMDRTGDAAVKLGGLYVHQGRLREAQRIYLQGADQHPENAELHASLGDVYLQLGVLGGALRAAERAAELEPDNPVWQFHLARVYERVHPEAAVEAWRRYLQLAQDRPEETQRRQIAAERLAGAR